MTRKATLRTPLLLTVLLVTLTVLFSSLTLVPAKAFEIPKWTPTAIPDGVDVWDGSTVSASLQGSGTEEEPYLIQSAADFAYFYANTNESDLSYYKMTTDVAFGVTSYVRPPATVTSGKMTNAIAGTLDGDGHTVYNIGSSQGDYGSGRNNNAPYLFAGVKSGAVVKNITFDGVYLRSTASSTGFFGGFDLGATLENFAILNVHNTTRAGYNSGVIANSLGNSKYNAVDENSLLKEHVFEGITVQGYCTATGGYGGGLFGRIDPSCERIVFRNCDVDLLIYSPVGTSAVNVGTYLGNVCAGYVSDGNKAFIREILFENCVSRGKIIMENAINPSSAGGFIGSANVFDDGGANYLKKVTFKNCINETNIELTGTSFGAVGGFVGRLGTDLNLSDCINTGDITATATAAPERVYGQAVGGFVGYLCRAGHNYATLNNCAQNGDISASHTAGGIVGASTMISTGDQYLMSGCSISGSIVGGTCAGGVVGLGYDGYVVCGYAGCGKQVIGWGCNDSTHREAGLDIYKTSNFVSFVLESCAIRAEITLGDGTPGSVFLHRHVSGKAGFLTVDANSYIDTNCTNYMNGAALSNHTVNPTKTGTAYTAEDYPDAIPANPADYDHLQYGALAKLNENAYTNGYHFWKLDEDGKLTITYDLAITTPVDLSRAYNAKPMSVVVTPHSSVSTYTIHWQEYSETEGRYIYLDTPPVDAGSYRLEIKTYDLVGDYAESVFRTFEISPIVIDLSNVQWEYSTPFVYDKEEHVVSFAVDALALPHLTITYENASATNAGTYTATATVVSNNANVEVVGTLAPFAWEIQKAVLDISDLSVTDTVVNYNGTPVKLPLHGEVFDWDALDIFYSETPINAGSYHIYITIELGDTTNYSGLVGNQNFEADLTILPIQLVLVAEDSTVPYTGSPIAFPITVLDQEGNEVTVEPVVSITQNGVPVAPDQVVNVGEYVFHLSFGNNTNYSGAEVTATLTVEKTTPTFSITDANDLVYDGESHPINVVSSTGKDFTITYYLNGQKVTAPKDAGTYTIEVSSEADGNHYAAQETLTLVISPREGLTVTAEAEQHLTYTGESLAPKAKVSGINATYSFTYFRDGVEVPEAVNAGTYKVLIYALSPDGNTYGEREVTLVIDRAETIITAPNKTVTYSGSNQSITAKKNHNESGLSITYTKNGVEIPAPKDAGVYVVKIHFNGSTNYKMADAIATLTILPKEVSVPNLDWEYRDNFTYDGETHTVVLEDVDGDMFFVEYKNNSFVNAGTYEATATVYCTPNYVFASGFDSETFTLSWQIKRATFSLAGVSLRDATIPYDGLAHSLTINGTLPAGVSVTYSGSYTDVGTYEITATFSVDDPNNFDAAAIESMTATLRITPVDYDMSGVTLSDSTIIYDGESHTLAISGTLPDGVSVNLEGVGVEPGAYTVVAHFTGDSNHNPIPDMKATLYILKVAAEDADKGVKLDVPGGIPHGGRVSVQTPYLISDQYDTSHILKSSSVKALFDLTIKNAAGQSLDCGTIRVYLPVGEEYDGEAAPCIVRILLDEAGNVTEILPVEGVTVQDGYYVFETNSLDGTFGVVTKDSNVGLIIGIVAGALLVAGGVTFAVIKVVSMRRRDLEDDE